jgi:hypothetical protein
MNLKSALCGEYAISQNEKKSISVYRVFDNVKGSLREVAELMRFKYDPNWTTRQMGAKICKEFGDGKRAQVGNYFIEVKSSGSIQTYRTYDNTIGALREIAGKIGFKYDPKWNTQMFGSKLIDAING